VGASASSRERRRLSSLLTTERIEEEWQILGACLKHLEDFLPPAVTERERARRSAIINEVAKHLFVGALMVLREYLPAQNRALMAAAGRFGIEKLRQGESCFRVRRVATVDKFADVFLAGLHEQLSSRLRGVWSKEPTVDIERSVRFVSKTGRYGEGQYRGWLRRRAIEQMLAAEFQAVLQQWRAEFAENWRAAFEDPEWIARELEAPSLPRRWIEPFGSSVARRLVRTSKGPVDLSYAVLAYLNGAAKRTVKAQIGAVRKDFAMNAKIDLALRARGYTAPLAATESS